MYAIPYSPAPSPKTLYNSAHSTQADRILFPINLPGEVNEALYRGFSKNDFHDILKNIIEKREKIEFSDIWSLIEKLYESHLITKQNKSELNKLTHMFKTKQFNNSIYNVKNKTNTEFSQILISEESLNIEDFSSENTEFAEKFLAVLKNAGAPTNCSLPTCKQFFIAMTSLIAAINPLLGGGGISSLCSFNKSFFNNTTEISPDVIGYILGSIASIMIAKSYTSTLPDLPNISKENSFCKNIKEFLNIIYAFTQAVPSALYTLTTTQNLLLLYLPFFADFEIQAIIVFVVFNFIYNAIFGLGQTEDLAKLLKDLSVDFQIKQTHTEKAVLIVNIIFSCFFASLVTFPYFISVYSPIKKFFSPQLGFFSPILSSAISVFINPAEFMYNFHPMKTFISSTGSDFKLILDKNKGVGYVFKIWKNRNLNMTSILSSFGPIGVSLVGAACTTEIFRETLVDTFDMNDEVSKLNKWLLILGTITHFSVVYVANRAALRGS